MRIIAFTDYANRAGKEALTNRKEEARCPVFAQGQCYRELYIEASCEAIDHAVLDCPRVKSSFLERRRNTDALSKRALDAGSDE